jgi:lipopolysaccharide export system permease protein
VTLLVYAISLYFLPLSFRTFKDLQFNIRNNYSTVLLQEGVFNTIGDDLTVYVRERTGEGELRGILVHDARDDDQPVTMMADRGAIVQSDQGPRVVLVDGNRQVVNPDQGRLQMLYFDRYTIDIDQLQTTVYSRRRSAEERYLSELLWPEDGASGAEFRAELAAEGHRRLSYPLYTLTFAMIGLAAILSGEFSRRGQIKRVLAAVAAVGGMQALQLTVSDLAMRSTTLIPAMYASVILGTGIAAWLLLYRPRRRRAAPAGRLSTEAAS